jgi:hypothetical protein
MKFVCLVYIEEHVMEGLSEAEARDLDTRSVNYDRLLMDRGVFIAAQALQPITAARTVKLRNGKLSMSDGPFAETKEHLGGLIIYEAPDMDEAMRIAAGVPMAAYGTLEVRPALELLVD